MSVFTGGPYGRLAIMLNTLSSLNIEIIIIIIIIIIITSVSSIYRLLAIDRRLSAAHFPNICYWLS